MQNNIKTWGKVLPTILAAIFLATASEAQSVFGDSATGGNAFSLGVDSFNSSGAAVEFTPLQDLILGSVTVSLTGFTGLDLNGDESRTLRAGIYSDYNPGTFDQPFQEIISLDTPAYNNGSLASFTFANPSTATTLQANTSYWLFIYDAATSAAPAADAYWVGGADPAGAATYNGSESFLDGQFSPSSETPAFAIDAVPEPGTTSMMMLSFLGAGVYALRFRRKNTV